MQAQEQAASKSKNEPLDEVQTTHYCMDIWRIPRELGATALQEKTAEKILEAENVVMKEYVQTHEGPFPEDSLANKAPMTFLESFAVISVMTIVMGGALYWSWAGLVVAIWGSWEQVFTYAVATVVLAFHPIPDISEAAYRSWFVHALYKYFTYRFMFTGNGREMTQKHQPFIGAGVPHGAIPFANLLSVPAVNSFLYSNEFVGCPASVVFHTPFLRYFTLFKSVTVSRESLTKQLENNVNVGLVGDGIAGIFKCNHTDEVVALKNRKGLARLALRTGRPVLPCYSVGNTEAFSVFFDRWGIMESISRKLQASIFFYWGRFGLPIPHRVNITMIVGDMVLVEKNENPTEEEIDQVHQRILASIESGFNAHKAALGWGHKTIKFV